MLAMGLNDFIDSMRKGFDDENKRIAKRQYYSQYRTAAQADDEYYNKFAQQGDGSLLQKYNSSFTSAEDKQIIANILESRGYSKHKNGTYGRR